MDEKQQRLSVGAAIQAADLQLAHVWARYGELDGNADLFELQAYLAGLFPLTTTECNLLAQAVNELIDELPPRPRAGYRHVPPRDAPRSGLAQIRQWLNGY